MTVATKLQPNYTTQLAAAYKAAIDAITAVHDRMAGAFAPHEQDVGSPAPDLSMRVDAGFIFAGTTLTEVASQTVSGFTTPSAGQERIDRVVLDAVTGVASRVAGTAATGSPSAVAPAIPTGKLPCCQIRFTDASTAVLNSMITDERVNSSGVSDASDSAKGIIEIAVQSEMETGSSTTLAVTPGRQQYHPSACKGWAKANLSGGAEASYNVSSISDSGVGNPTCNWATDFSSDHYAPHVQGWSDTTGYSVLLNSGTGAGAVNAVFRNTGGTDTDPNYMIFTAFGDQ